jgi:hypothetical protein
VDGSDPQWQKAFRAAKNASARGGDTTATGGDTTAVATGGDENTSEIRYRDWGTLPYLLRGIEKFAPWARRVHLVTWGHVPPWLDVSNPRLGIVRHEDYLPAEYRPAFSAQPIELCIHRIEGLAEQFILFNDDMFLCRPVPATRFFRRGLPCDMARLSLIARSTISHIVLNNTEVLNRRHDRRAVMRRDFWKWYSPKYGPGNLLKTLDLSVWRGFAGLADTHQPQPYLKSVFEEMWRDEHAVLDATCRMRFRSPFGVNHWLMRYEQLATGQFEPVSMRDARLDALDESRIADIEHYIGRRKYAMVCLNDSPALEDFDGVSARLKAALETILPEKSSYEK